MLPEISHRCSSCGASIRERAMFCPECGKTLTEPGSEVTEQLSSQIAQESAVNNGAAAPVVDPPKELPADGAAITESEPAKESIVEDRHTARGRTKETLHRASTRARGAIEGNVKRVEKIHHVSSVMFEEAHYDPSLRFVLVALGLFIVFVILLVLSKVMG